MTVTYQIGKTFHHRGTEARRKAGVVGFGFLCASVSLW
jgi:hypothetical protein